MLAVCVRCRCMPMYANFSVSKTQSLFVYNLTPLFTYSLSHITRIYFQIVSKYPEASCYFNIKFMYAEIVLGASVCFVYGVDTV